MLNFLKKFFVKRRLGANISSRDEPILVADSEVESVRSRYPLSFTIHSAHGGYIISTRVHNRKLDEWESVNYIVHEDGEIAKTVERIVFIEGLKQ